MGIELWVPVAVTKSAALLWEGGQAGEVENARSYRTEDMVWNKMSVSGRVLEPTPYLMAPASTKGLSMMVWKRRLVSGRLPSRVDMRGASRQNRWQPRLFNMRSHSLSVWPAEGARYKRSGRADVINLSIIHGLGIRAITLSARNVSPSVRKWTVLEVSASDRMSSAGRYASMNARISGGNNSIISAPSTQHPVQSPVSDETRLTSVERIVDHLTQVVVSDGQQQLCVFVSGQGGMRLRRVLQMAVEGLGKGGEGKRWLDPYVDGGALMASVLAHHRVDDGDGGRRCGSCLHPLGQTGVLPLDGTAFALIPRNSTVPQCVVEDAEVAVARRREGEPVPYITGFAEFYDADFRVTLGDGTRVLVPRPETEVMVDLAVEVASAKENATEEGVSVLELGVGSGAALLSIMRLLQAQGVEGVEGVGTDVNPGALRLVAENAARLGIPLPDLHEADPGVWVADGWRTTWGGRFDVIVSNPPYLTQDDMDVLDTPLTFEPVAALAGGWDGLDPYRALLDAEGGVRSLLTPGGSLIMEIGSAQAADVISLATAAGVWDSPCVVQDLSGRDRVVHVRPI